MMGLSARRSPRFHSGADLRAAADFDIVMCDRLHRVYSAPTSMRLSADGGTPARGNAIFDDGFSDFAIGRRQVQAAVIYRRP